MNELFTDNVIGIITAILTSLGTVITTLVTVYQTLWKRIILQQDKRIEDKDKLIGILQSTIKEKDLEFAEAIRQKDLLLSEITKSKDSIIEKQQAKLDEIYQVAMIKYTGKIS